METQTASLVTMDAATSEDSVAAYAEDLLAGTGWQVDSVRRRGNRLEPPDSYWSLFKVGVSHINKDEEERDLRLVAKGALNPEAWAKLAARLERHGAGNRSDPINGIGSLRLPAPWRSRRAASFAQASGFRAPFATRRKSRSSSSLLMWLTPTLNSDQYESGGSSLLPRRRTESTCQPVPASK